MEQKINPQGVYSLLLEPPIKLLCSVCPINTLSDQIWMRNTFFFCWELINLNCGFSSIVIGRFLLQGKWGLLKVTVH